MTHPLNSLNQPLEKKESGLILVCCSPESNVNPQRAVNPEGVFVACI